MTHDQHIASDPGLSVWVSANAGTGKTKVLTDRVLRLLLTGATPARILCITYTRAAAAEMEARISGQLARWVTVDDESLTRELEALRGEKTDPETLALARRLFAQVLDAPERIRIQTIHGLCQSVLTRFPLEAEVPPHFTLIDEITSNELLDEVKSWLFSNAQRSENQAAATAIAELAAHMSEASLNELISEIIHSRRKFSEWLGAAQGAERIYEALELKPETSEEQLFTRHFNYTQAEENALLGACAALGQSSGKIDSQMHHALRVWLEKREQSDVYVQAFITDKNGPRKQLCTKNSEKLLPQIKEILLAEQKRVMEWFDQSQSLFIAKMSVHVSALSAAILELYHRSKQKRGYLDYDDLILSVARLFDKPGIAPWVLYKLDGGIDHLLVDEAQDTSPAQWRIVNMLASEFFAGESARTLKRTLFVVGDEKQSIFSFQGAEPLEFDAMQRRLSKLAGDAGADFRRVRLARSFRSTGPVLEAVDTVFALPKAREGLIFTESDITHELHRTGAAGRVELWPLSHVPEEEGLGAWHIPDASRFIQRPDMLCAEQIAALIAEWMKEKRQLTSQGRAVRPGDIMILVQRRGAFADYMLRALRHRNVPVAGADRLMLAEHIAVQDCVALARFLLLPKDDLTLAEVLRSPIIGLSEEALFTLAYNRGDHSLWQRLRETPEQKEVTDFLLDILAKTDFYPPFELFTYILETCEVRARLAKRLGDEIDDPLNELLALAMHYDQTHPPSLQGFLHWLEAGEIEIKRDMEKGRDEVRILTVHSAKGLQAPIVFLPDTVRMPPPKSGIFWAADDQSVPLFSPSSSEDDSHYRELRQVQRVAAGREYRRLLYVAMTRAEDELYVCGWKGDRAVSEDSWYELVRLAAAAWSSEEENLVLASPQTAAVKTQFIKDAAPYDEILPLWLQTAPLSEPLPSKPLSPSRMQAARDVLSPYAAQARVRGILMHRLLQYLPDAAEEERAQALHVFMQRYGAELPAEEQDKVASEVTAILNHPEFAPVFGPDSVAEVSIAGVTPGSNGLSIAGRIDRLAVLPNAVYIIDYKTGRKVPDSEADIPVAYLKQMEAYRQLISGIYPDKIVYCGIIWTTGPRLFVLSDAILESLAA